LLFRHHASLPHWHKDAEAAALYGVETKVLLEAVK